MFTRHFTFSVFFNSVSIKLFKVCLSVCLSVGLSVCLSLHRSFSLIWLHSFCYPSFRMFALHSVSEKCCFVSLWAYIGICLVMASIVPQIVEIVKCVKWHYVSNTIVAFRNSVFSWDQLKKYQCCVIYILKTKFWMAIEAVLAVFCRI